MATLRVDATIISYNNNGGESSSCMQIGRLSAGALREAMVRIPAFNPVGTITAVRMYFQWNNEANGTGWSGTFTHRIEQNGQANNYTVSGGSGSTSTPVSGWSRDGWDTVITVGQSGNSTMKSYLKSVYIIVTYTPNSKPNKPTSVSASPSLLNAGGNITVNWNNPGDPDGDLTGFEIAMQRPDGSWYGSPTILKSVGVVTSTTIPTSGWSANGVWHFKVRGKDSWGAKGDWSDVRSGAITINGAPNAPDNFRFDSTNKAYDYDGFTAYWDNNGDPNGNLQKFFIMLYKYHDGAWSALTGWLDKLTATSHAVSRAQLLAYGVEPGDYVGFDVQAQDTLDKATTAALHADYYIKLAGDPTAPTSLTPTGGIYKDAVTFAWSGAGAGVGASISRYDLRYLVEGGSWVTVQTTDLSYTLNLASLNVPRGGSLKVQVCTVNNFGVASDWSDEAIIYRNQLPAAPTNIGPAAGVYTTALPLTWDAGSDADAGQTLKYKIEIWNKPTGTESFVLYQTINDVSAANYNYSMVSRPHGEYKARIYTVDNLSEISAAYAESPVYRPYGDPTAPTLLTPASGVFKDVVTFEWSGAGAGAGASISRYEISYSINGGTATEVSATSASKAFTLVSLGVGRGQSLAVKVRAVNNFNIASDWSDEAIVYRNQLPAAPTNISPAAGTYPDTVPLSWSAGVDPDGQAVSHRLEIYSSPPDEGNYTLYETIPVSGASYTYPIGTKPNGDYKGRLYTIDSLDEVSAAYTETPVYKNNRNPNAITTLIPSTGLFASEIPLAWNEVTDPDGDDIDYLTEAAFNDGSGYGSFAVVDTVETNSYTYDISAHPRGRRYNIRVTPVDENGGVGPSKTVYDLGRNRLPLVPSVAYPLDGSTLFSDRPHFLLTIPTEPDAQQQIIIGGASEDHKSNVQTSEFRPSGLYNGGTKVIFRPASGLNADSNGAFSIPFKHNDGIENGPAVTLNLSRVMEPFTDEPFTADTRIRAIHAFEARTAINTLRAAYGLSAKSWAYTIAPDQTVIRIGVLYELRAALDELINRIKGWNPGVSFPEFVPWSTVVANDVISKANMEEIHQIIRSI